MESEKKEFKFTVTPDRTQVLLDCTVEEGALDDVISGILDALKEKEIAQPPDRDQLRSAISNAIDENNVVEHLLIVQGQEPVAGQDGTVEWVRDFFSTGFAFDDKTGAIDYRQRKDNLEVQQDEMLCRVIPPLDGQAGTDVYGKLIPFKKGKPAKLSLGPNVRRDPDGAIMNLHSECSGRVRWVGGKLSVDPVYVIQGSVDLETGNVTHKGAVVVNGDITAGFQVQALGDIEIAGIIEPSNIATEGNLIVRGGITGSPEHRVQAKGSVSARFIQDAFIDMQGDLVVESEIMHSTIRTLGKLSMPRGRFVGGSIIARGGIELKEAGGPGATPTTLAVGEDYLLQQEVQPRYENLKRLEANLEKMRSAVDPMMSRIKLLNPKQREALTTLMAKISEMDVEAATLREEIATLENESREKSVREIIVLGTVHPETTLRIDGCGFRVMKTSQGPLRASVVARKVVLEPMR